MTPRGIWGVLIISNRSYINLDLESLYSLKKALSVLAKRAYLVFWGYEPDACGGARKHRRKKRWNMEHVKINCTKQQTTPATNEYNPGKN